MDLVQVLGSPSHSRVALNSASLPDSPPPTGLGPLLVLASDSSSQPEHRDSTRVPHHKFVDWTS